jgi:hypothetical protein
VQVEIDVLERDDARKSLGETTSLEQGRGHWECPPA